MPSPSVLVVGAGGFVGRHLVPALRAGGWEVRAATRGGGAEGEVALDVTDPGSVRRAFAAAPPPDAVVHLAALAHLAPGSVPDEAYDAVNHRGMTHVLEAARAAGVARFVFFSSASVYGEEGRRGPVREDAELRPAGAYGRSKAAAEEALRGADGVAGVSLRFPAIYAAEWLVDVRKRACVPGTGGRLLLAVPGRPPRYSLCAVQHAVAAVRLALEGRIAAGACNVADPEPYRQDEVAAVIGRVDGVSRRLPIPRALARAALLGGAALLPRRRAAGVRTNYWKLFEGLVLDTSRLQASGFRPRARLGDLAAGADARRG